MAATPPTSFLITGANGGLGKDAARQLALRPQTTRIVLACRSEQKAQAVKAELEQATGRQVFEVLIVDVADLDSVRAAVGKVAGPIEGVVLNAGGPGGAGAGDRNDLGVVHSFAVNVLGHAALVQGLIDTGKLTGVVAFVSSEAARGIPSMGMKRPALPSSSVEDFVSIADGSLWSDFDAMTAYGPIKYLGTMWMSAMARRHPDVRFVSVSPGATSGTNAADQLGAVQRFLYTRIAFPIMTLIGRAHGVEVGAHRYVDVLTDSAYASGHFYASPWPSTSGPLVDQSQVFADLTNTAYQDNAYQAVQHFLAPAA